MIDVTLYHATIAAIEAAGIDRGTMSPEDEYRANLIAQAMGFDPADGRCN